MRSVLLLVLLLLAGCTSLDRSRSEPTSRLQATIQAHLAAIESRDLDALLDTVTTGERLTLIFPDGTLYTTRDDYVAFHEEWFADPNWTMTFEPVRTVESPGLATVVFRTAYEDEGPASRRYAFLTLTFADGGNGWRLVLDQNTRIVSPG
jgi:ketosteroid isomerase-like protein